MSQPSFSRNRLRKVFKRMQELRILVVGDLMLDEFVWGAVSRISPEAPVPVIKVTKESFFPGGAANVSRNLTDFGIKVGICGVVGKDPAGDKLCKILRKSSVDTKGLFIESRYSTIVKTRVIAQNQQVARVDRESSFRFRAGELSRVKTYLAKAIPNYDAIIVEDYGKGFLTQEFFNEIAKVANENNKILAVDPNPGNFLDFNGATVVKPNKPEAFVACNQPVSDDVDAISKVGDELMKKWESPYVLITLGEDGMMLFQRFLPPYHTPTKSKEVFDVSGAGDTSIAFFVAGLAAGLNGNEAAEIANHAAGVVVGKLGTATITQDELLESFQNNEKKSKSGSVS